MKDIRGIELKIGDLVALNPQNYKGIVLGRIKKFTPKMVTVQYSKQENYKDEKNEYPSQIAFLEREEI